MTERLLELIKSATRILVITHVGPDPDAFTSMLLTGTTLMVNFPNKQVMMSTEERTGDLSPLYGYQLIKIQTLEEAIDNFKPKLIIMVDAMNFKRCTRKDANKVSRIVKEAKIPLVIIDHHEPELIEKNEIYINNGGPAAVQEVYEILFEQLGLKKPEGYAQTTMLGLYSDSGRFINNNPRYKETFRIVQELISDGANMEMINNILDRHSIDEMRALAELAKNLDYIDDYNFSYISDEFTKNWEKSGNDFETLKVGISNFVNIYIRNIGERKWGFVIYKDLAAGKNIYGVSLRSLNGVKNVHQVAKKLGGGGHILAAGAKFEATSVEEALQKVRDAIC